MTNALQREVVLGLLKIHILHHACCEGVVGNQILLELRSHGYEVSPGTLYPMLHRMKRAGWLALASSTPGAHGSRRYEITPRGQEQLETFRHAVRELHREIAERCVNPHVRTP